MTAALTLARRCRRSLEEIVKVPPAIAGMIEMELAREFEIHGAVEALRTIADHRDNVVVTGGHISADPPLTDAELALLHEMMSNARLPVIHSFVELTRTMLERTKDKP